MCQVALKQVPPQVDQESLEIDDFLDNSLVGSSFLILNGLPGEVSSSRSVRKALNPPPTSFIMQADKTNPPFCNVHSSADLLRGDQCGSAHSFHKEVSFFLPL